MDSEEKQIDDRNNPALMALTVLVTNFHLAGVNMAPYLKQIQDLAKGAAANGFHDSANALNAHVERVVTKIGRETTTKH